MGAVAVAVLFTQLLAAQFKQNYGGYRAMQTIDIGHEIRSFLAENFLSGRKEKLSDNEQLLGNVVDSTGVVELVVFLQERFDITVEDEEVTAENLGSVQNAITFIERKLLKKA